MVQVCIHIVIIFSMGNKTHLQYLKCESKFEKIYPVGSLFMNSVKFNKKIYQTFQIMIYYISLVI